MSTTTIGERPIGSTRRRLESVRETMTEVLGIKFAPLRIPLERRLQTLGALHHFCITLVTPAILLVLPFYLMFTMLWPLVLLYAAWLWYDWDSPRRGAYPSQWWRDLTVHKWFADYFPVKLHKTAELPADQNYLIGSHPHGIISMSAFINFSTNGTGVNQLFPGIDFKLCTLEGQFWTPLRREWGLLHGMIGCSRQSLNTVLGNNQKGQAAILVVGGAEEALDAHPGHHILTLNNRKGFVRIAIQNGSHLVPCFHFGENDIYEQAENPKGSTIRTIQTTMKNVLGFSPPVFHGRGVFNYTFGLLPFRKPINTVVGAPIPVIQNDNPTQEEVAELHALYMQKLTELFDAHKTKFGVSENAKLVIQ